jgi:hypothetical protein
MAAPIRRDLSIPRVAALGAGVALAGLALALLVAARPVEGASVPGGHLPPAGAQDETATPTPVALGSGALDQIAATLAEGSPVMPSQSDAGLGGLAATIALLACALAAAAVTGTAVKVEAPGAAARATAAATAQGEVAEGGVEDAAGVTARVATEPAPAPLPGRVTRGNGQAAGDGEMPSAVALAGLTTAAGSGLPLPRSELVAASGSIARSMRRLTGDGPVGDRKPARLSQGDVVQLLGDAASIGALATILAPATGLVALAGSGAATVAEAGSPNEVLERLRRSFGQLGYMQGVLDENICACDGQLVGLDGAPHGAAAGATPRFPHDVPSLPDKELRALRGAWAAYADAQFDALIEAQQGMSELDDRRRNLAHQADAVNDLLARLDEAGTTPVPRHLGDTLCYGLGWYQSGDPARMAAALRESRATSKASAMAATLRDSQAMARASAIVTEGAVRALGRPNEPGKAGQPAPSGKRGKPARPGKAAPSAQDAVAVPSAVERPRSLPFAEWAAANRFTGGRLGVLQALAGLERWSGFYDALTGTLQRQIIALRAQADAAGATRRILSSEIQHRTLEAGVEGTGGGRAAAAKPQASPKTPVVAKGAGTTKMPGAGR